MYDTNRPAFLERDLVGLSVGSNWQVWVRYCCGEPVPNHTVGKGATGSVIHKLPDSTPDHIRCQFETAYQLVLQSRHNPGLNIRYPPHIPPSPQGHLKFRFSLLYSTAEEGLCVWAEILIFVSFHLCMS